MNVVWKKQMFLPRHLKDYHLRAVAIMRSKCALTQNKGSSEERKRCAHVADTTEEQLSVFPRQNQSVSESTAEPTLPFLTSREQY